MSWSANGKGTGDELFDALDESFDMSYAQASDEVKEQFSSAKLGVETLASQLNWEHYNVTLNGHAKQGDTGSNSVALSLNDYKAAE